MRIRNPQSKTPIHIEFFVKLRNIIDSMRGARMVLIWGEGRTPLARPELKHFGAGGVRAK
jgi:hypothetical protein